MKHLCYKTREQLVRMLLTSTGRALCDSGGAYGRHWETNRQKAQLVLDKPEIDLTPGSEDLRTLVDFFDESPRTFLSWWNGQPEMQISVYHFLASNLVFQQQGQRWFDRFVEWWDANEEESHWLDYAREFPDWLSRQYLDVQDLAFVDFEVDEQLELPEDLADTGYVAEGISQRWATDQLSNYDQLSDYDEQYLLDVCGFTRPKVGGFFDDDQPLCINTYNHEDWLSQTLQYIGFSVEDQRVALMQIHQGCDVRGGYTPPSYFDVSGDDHELLSNAEGDIYCTSDVQDGPYDEPHYWCFQQTTDPSDAGYRGCWGGQTKPPVIGEQPFDLDDQDVLSGLARICGLAEFEPHAYWLHLTRDLLPTRLAAVGVEGVDQWLAEEPTMELPPEEAAAQVLHFRCCRSVWDHWEDDRRLGVTFYNKKQGHCPVCGGLLEFQARGIQ